ncbi:unnamed protein product, partial [Amoebophrya sp. A120]|eukprot:GSA120T00003290001.1
MLNTTTRAKIPISWKIANNGSEFAWDKANSATLLHPSAGCIYPVEAELPSPHRRPPSYRPLSWRPPRRLYLLNR